MNIGELAEEAGGPILLEVERDALRARVAELEAKNKRLMEALAYLVDEADVALADIDIAYADDTSKGLRKAWLTARALLREMGEKP